MKIIDNTYQENENEISLNLLIKQIIFLGDTIKYICSNENTNDIILKKTRSEIENKINIGDKIKVYFNINECTLLND